MLRRATVWALNMRSTTRNALTTLAASAAFTVAGFEWHPIAGWVVIGVGLLATEAAASPEPRRA